MATEYIGKEFIEFTDGQTEMTFFTLDKSGSVQVNMEQEYMHLDQQNIRTLIEHLQKQITPCTTQ